MEIKKTSDKKGLRINGLVYGQSGIGKTTLASTLLGKTLIVSAEAGLLSLADKKIDFVEIKGGTAEEKLKSLSGIIKFLNGENDYRNIFIDSLTEISQIIVEYQFDQIGNDRGKGLVAWGEYSRQIKSFIKLMRDMTRYNIIFTALDKHDKDELGRRFTCPDLNGQIALQCPQYFDEVFYMTTIKTEDGKLKRVLVTCPYDGAIAKDRSGKLSNVEVSDLGELFRKIEH